MVLCARLYGDLSLRGIGGMWGPRVAEPASLALRRMSDNVTQSVVDTMVASCGENKPKPYFLTSGGDYKAQRRAKKRNQFIDGLFYENKAYDLGGDAQRDAGIFGDGLIKVFEKHGRACFERRLSLEIWIDEVEGAYGFPRSGHEVRAVDRLELIAWAEDTDYGGSKDKKAALEAIWKADKAELQDKGNPANVAEMVTVRESWHLKSGPKSEDGKHCISIDGTLIDPMLPWEHPWFPFARFRWCPRPFGYWSQSLCEQLKNKQVEVNEILQMMQRSYHLASTFKVLVEAGSKIVKEHMNNDVGSILSYVGQKPEYVVPQVVPPEYYEHYERLVASMYERIGQSLMLATGEKPAGINSGEAQRVYNATNNRRFKTIQRYNDRGFTELAIMGLAIAGDIAKKNGGHYEVAAPGKKATCLIDLADCKIDEDSSIVQCFTISSLPSDPSGRLQTITEYIQAGMITQRQGRRALDFPDLETIESLANASEDIITETLDNICDDGEYEPPEPTDDLQLAKELVVEYINRGRSQKLEEERLDMLRAWSAALDVLTQAAQPPAQPALPNVPQGTAPAPPQAQLLPQAAA